MANPALTQTQFTYIGKRLFYVLGKAFELRQHRYRYEKSEVRVVNAIDKNGNNTLWYVYGANIGVNTAANGDLFIRHVANVGDWDVKLYKATGGGGGDLVAQATAVADGATATLTAQNSSGLTASCVLDATVVAEADDVHKLNCIVDYPVRDVQVFDGTETRDAEMRAILSASNASVVTSLKAAEEQLINAFKQVLTIYVAERINAGSSTPLNATSEPQAGGAISLSVEGILEELRLAMIDNTTAQSVREAVIAAGSPAFAAVNQGAGTMAAPDMLEKALPGTLTFRCTGETVGSEKFAVSHRRSDNGEIVNADNEMTIGQEFKDAKIGIASCLLERSLSKTGDGSNVYFSALNDGNWSVAGENPRNTDAGILHWSVVASATAGKWDVKYYKSSARQIGDLVAQALATDDAELFQAVAYKRSGLTVNGKGGSTMAAATGTLDLKCFKSGPPADQITVAVTRTSSGEIQKFLAELITEQLSWYLEGASSSETLPDTLMTGGITTLYGKNS